MASVVNMGDVASQLAFCNIPNTNFLDARGLLFINIPQSTASTPTTYPNDTQVPSLPSEAG